MRAVNLEAPGKIAVVDIPMPSPAKGWALLKVKGAGICGSDIGAFRGVNPLVSYPRIIGHEIAGEVMEINADGGAVKVGDHVIVDPYMYCGECYPCSLGRTNCCERLEVLGVHRDGGMAEYMAHPVSMLVKAPDAMPWDIVPLAEPLTIALHGLHRARVKSGEHVAISGAGPIGILIAMGALHYGAIPIVVDMVKERLELARQVGVGHAIDFSAEDPAKSIEAITSGRMAEAVIEASGANQAIQNTLEFASYAGRIVLTGWPKDKTLLDTAKITKKELDIMGGRTSAGEFKEALDLIDSSKVNAKAVLSELVDLADVLAIVKAISDNPGNYMKVNVKV